MRTISQSQNCLVHTANDRARKKEDEQGNSWNSPPGVDGNPDPKILRGENCERRHYSRNKNINVG